MGSARPALHGCRATGGMAEAIAWIMGGRVDCLAGRTGDVPRGHPVGAAAGRGAGEALTGCRATGSTVEAVSRMTCGPQG